MTPRNWETDEQQRRLQKQWLISRQQQRTFDYARNEWRLISVDVADGYTPQKPEPRRNGMNQSLAVFLINDGARAILCTYEADPPHAKAPTSMFKTLDPAIKAGDYVTVPTDTRHKMTVVRVAETDVDVDFDSSVQIGWIIGVVERADHEHLVAKEADAIQKINAAMALKKKKELREALLGLDQEQMKALPLASMKADGGTKPAE